MPLAAFIVDGDMGVGVAVGERLDRSLDGQGLVRIVGTPAVVGQGGGGAEHQGEEGDEEGELSHGGGLRVATRKA
ncbi:hypothetical protein D3C81_1866010 [compost metagenome]